MSPSHDVRRSDDSNWEKTGDADDAESQIQKPMKGCKSQSARRETGNEEGAKSQAAKAKTPPAEAELGMQRMRKAKAKKPRSQEAKKPNSQEAKKPRSQEAKKQKAKKKEEEKKNSQKINLKQIPLQRGQWLAIYYGGNWDPLVGRNHCLPVFVLLPFLLFCLGVAS